MTKEDLQSLLFRNMHWISKGLQYHSYVANVQKKGLYELEFGWWWCYWLSASHPYKVVRYDLDQLRWWNLPLYIILYYISLTFITTTNYENLIFQANEWIRIPVIVDQVKPL